MPNPNLNYATSSVNNALGKPFGCFSASKRNLDAMYKQEKHDDYYVNYKGKSNNKLIAELQDLPNGVPSEIIDFTGNCPVTYSSSNNVDKFDKMSMYDKSSDLHIEILDNGNRKANGKVDKNDTVIIKMGDKVLIDTSISDFLHGA